MDISTVSFDNVSLCPASATKLVARHPLAVLGVPAYNEARWIQQTLRSIQNQSHHDFSVLISDNASTDGTSEICASFAREDPRFLHVRHEGNRGASANFGFAHEASESPYFAWVGAHDLLHRDFLSAHLCALQRQPHAAASFTYFEWIDAEDKTIFLEHDEGIATPQHGAWFRYLWSIAIGSDLGPMHALFRRSAMPVPAARPVPAGDHVLLAEIAFHGPFLAQPGHLYRLRHFTDGRDDESMMRRITGRSGVQADFSATISAYLADFDRMHPSGSRGRRLRPVVSWLLHDRLDRKSLRLTKRLRSVVKRLHDLRAWLRPRSTDQR